jgi:hypothetical protein
MDKTCNYSSIILCRQMCKRWLHGEEARRKDWFSLEDLNRIFTYDLCLDTDCWAYFTVQLNQSYQ